MTSTIKLFPKIEHYDGRPLNDHHIVSEKLDGTNTGIYIPNSGKITVFSRNGGDFAFSEYQYVIDNLRDQLEVVRNEGIRHYNSDLILYGELTGPKINRRIDYGDPCFHAFALYVVNENRFIDPRLIPSCIPQVTWKVYQNPDDIALPITSKFANTKSNAEGYVIHELDDSGWVIQSFKHKDPAFGDKTFKAITSAEAEEMHKVFVGYLTYNRMIDTISKGYDINDNKNIPNIIRAFVDDAKQDFFKDYPINQSPMNKFTNDDLKMIINSKSVPFLLFKQVKNTLLATKL